MYRFALLTLCLLVLAGCGDKKNQASVVTGTIKYKSQPVNGGTVVLFLTSGTGDAPPIRIPITQNGTFRSGDVPEGEYKVVVEPSAGSPRTMPKGQESKLSAEDKARLDAMSTPSTITIPEKYKKRTDSDLTIKVGKGDQTVTLELRD